MEGSTTGVGTHRSARIQLNDAGMMWNVVLILCRFVILSMFALFETCMSYLWDGGFVEFLMT